MTKDSLKFHHMFRVTIERKSNCIKGSTITKKMSDSIKISITIFHSMSHHKYIHWNSTSGFINNKSSNCGVIVLKAYAGIITKISRIAKLQNFSKRMRPYIMEIPRGDTKKSVRNNKCRKLHSVKVIIKSYFCKK